MSRGHGFATAFSNKKADDTTTLVNAKEWTSSKRLKAFQDFSFDSICHLVNLIEFEIRKRLSFAMKNNTSLSTTTTTQDCHLKKAFVKWRNVKFFFKLYYNHLKVHMCL